VFGEEKTERMVGEAEAEAEAAKRMVRNIVLGDILINQKTVHLRFVGKMIWVLQTGELR